MQNLQLLVDFYKRNKRQGPGADAETRKAFSLTGISPDEVIEIADIGCGAGAQALALAEISKGNITAVDLFPEFLEMLDEKVKSRGLSGRISTYKALMEDLPFAEEQFDMIWSEGAIYIMGFEKGLLNWQKFLKPGGHIAVSEISWLTSNRPVEIENYWKDAYHGIDTIPNKLTQFENAGYRPKAHFILPEYCWIENYYGPMNKLISGFLAENNNSPEAIELVEAEREEQDLFHKYKEFYGYVFYIGKKV